MKEIGGYFELELRKGKEYHPDALALNTGRNALELILISKKYSKVFLPYFTCDVIIEPFIKHGISYEFYSINADFEPIFDFSIIKNDEGFLYTNYFGLKDIFIEQIATICKNLIVDSTQSFFSMPIIGIPTFYSCRKFFGVPDGAYLYTTARLEDKFEVDKSLDRFSHLLKRIDSGASNGYTDFKNNDLDLSGQPIKLMSKLTKSLLCNIDYEFVKERRIDNFNFLHNYLSEENDLNFELENNSVPMVYPFLTKRLNLKQNLIDNKIYVATYWPNVTEWCDYNSLEYKLTKQLIHLPIDQRYNLEDIKLIVDLLLS
jgi:hypothetical protein